MKPERMIRMLSAGVLVATPLTLMVGFALHFTNLADFFRFRLRYEPAPPPKLLALLASPERWRGYMLPHYVAYLGIPLVLGTALILGRMLYARRPWLALLGTGMSIVGSVFMGGVFGAWLAFGAVGDVAAADLPGALPVLEALTTMQGALKFTSVLAGLSLLGLLVLAGGLFASRIGPRWASVLLFVGQGTILVFMDLDNLMFIGGTLMLIGLVPYSMRLLHQPEAFGRRLPEAAAA